MRPGHPPAAGERVLQSHECLPAHAGPSIFGRAHSRRARISGAVGGATGPPRLIWQSASCGSMRRWSGGPPHASHRHGCRPRQRILAISRLSSRPIAVARDLDSSSFIPSRPAGACGERLVCRAGQRHPIAPALWSRVSSGDPPLAQPPRDAGISQLGPNPCRRALAGLPHPPGRISCHAPSRAGYA